MCSLDVVHLPTLLMPLLKQRTSFLPISVFIISSIVCECSWCKSFVHSLRIFHYHIFITVVNLPLKGYHKGFLKLKNCSLFGFVTF